MEKNLINQIEEILNSIPGVISSKVIQKDSGEMEEIHILATTERNPKQLSRDIQSILLAKFHMDFDHKKISIAQIVDQSLQRPDKRIQIEEVSYTITGNQAKAAVSLKQDGEIFQGVEEGYNTQSNTRRLVANATLKALERLIQGNWFYSVEDIEQVVVAKKEVLLVAITIGHHQQEELLIGSALVKSNLNEAIVKATLDAVNRKLVKLIPSSY